jgi:hypothetical protein
MKMKISSSNSSIHFSLKFNSNSSLNFGCHSLKFSNKIE